MKEIFSGKKVLITGGAGFVGSNLALCLDEKKLGCDVTVFDIFQSNDKFPNGHYKALGHYKNLIKFKGKIISGDILNTADLAILSKTKWDFIFHQAAISDTTIADQNLVLKTNTSTLDFFVDLSVKCDAHLVYASSAATYGNTPSPNTVGIGEEPENIYGFSKLMMDRTLESKLKMNPSLKITGLRYFNIYGPGEFYKGNTSSMILKLGTQILAGGPIQLFKFGEQKRDFIYIDDVINANLNAIQKESGIYNIGTGISRTFNECVNILFEVLQKRVDIEYIENPYNFYQNDTCADIQTAKQYLNFDPIYSLEDGIAAYRNEIIELYKKNGGIS